MVEIVHFKFIGKTPSRRHVNPAKRTNKRNSDAFQIFSYPMLLGFLVKSWGTFMEKKSHLQSSKKFLGRFQSSTSIRPSSPPLFQC